MAPSKLPVEIHPDNPSTTAIFDPRHPDMVKAWGTLDTAFQMLSLYPEHRIRVTSIVKQRAARLLAQAGTVKRPRADPRPGDADYDDEDAAVIAVGSAEDAIGREEGEDIPGFEDSDFEETDNEEEPPTTDDAGSSRLAGVPAMVPNPTFREPPPSPHVAMTRSATVAAAAQAAAAAGGVDRPASVGGASATERAGASKLVWIHQARLDPAAATTEDLRLVVVVALDPDDMEVPSAASAT
jgi:hypothetical protein